MFHRVCFVTVVQQLEKLVRLFSLAVELLFSPLRVIIRRFFCLKNGELYFAWPVAFRSFVSFYFSLLYCSRLSVSGNFRGPTDKESKRHVVHSEILLSTG